MPTFDFRCPEGHLHENTFPINAEKRESLCPCGKKTVRLFGNPSIRLRGGGESWHETQGDVIRENESSPEFRSGKIQRKGNARWV